MNDTPTEQPLKRGPGRPPLHPRAEDRQPMRSTRVRKRKFQAGEDRFGIPVDEIPEGSSYEWKRWSVNGEEQPFYLANMREQGWEPVEPRRHPNWLPENYDRPHIIKEGLILMERPMELTLEAREETRKLSLRQVRDQMAQLGQAPPGTGPRDVDPRIAPSVKTEMMRQISVQE